MGEPLTRKLAGSGYIMKCVNFWQAVLRFGLPFIILFRGIDYMFFRVARGNAPLPYPWGFDLATDSLVTLFVSVLWWLYAREVAALRRKNEQG